MDNSGQSRGSYNRGPGPPDEYLDEIREVFEYYGERLAKLYGSVDKEYTTDEDRWYLTCETCGKPKSIEKPEIICFGLRGISWCGCDDPEQPPSDPQYRRKNICGKKDPA